jgi:hypothetical protein
MTVIAGQNKSTGVRKLKDDKRSRDLFFFAFCLASLKTMKTVNQASVIIDGKVSAMTGQKHTPL